MKKAIIIIVSVLVVAVATCTGLYFFTDVFNFIKPASANFSSQAKKLLGTDKDNKYSDYEAILNKLKISDKSYTSNADISMNLSVPSNYVDSSTQKLINSSKIKYTGSYDANSKAMSNNVGLYKDNKEFLTLQLVQKDQTVSVGCKDLYDKTLNFDLSKYDEFCQKNNITADQETKASIDVLKSMKDSNYTDLLYNLLYLSEDDFNSLNKTYGNLLSDLISKDNYSTKKNQKITVGGDDIKTTAYSLTLSGEDAYNFINKFVDLMKNDDTTKKLIIDKYNILKKYNSSLISTYDEVENNLPNSDNELPDLTTDKLNSLFDDFIDDLEDSKDNFTDSDKCLNFTIYSDKKSEPVKFEISVLDDKKDKDGKVIFTEELSDGKTKYVINLENINKLSGNSTDEDIDTYEDSITNTTKNTLRNSSSKDLNVTKSLKTPATKKNTSIFSTLDDIADSISEVTIEDSYKKNDDSRKGTITISAKASGSKQDLLKIDYENINSKSEYKTSFSVSSPLKSSISLDFVFDINGLDNDTQDMKFELSGKYSLYSAKLSATSSITYGKSDIPNLTSDNSIDVFSLQQADLQKIYTDVITKAADTLPSKLSLYGITVTRDEILSLLPASTTDTSVANTVDSSEPAA